MQGAGFHPAFALHIEGMLGGGINDLLHALAVGDGHVGDFLRGVDEGADNLFVGVLAGFLVGRQNHVSRLDILNRYQASSGDNHSPSHKALGMVLPIC